MYALDKHESTSTMPRGKFFLPVPILMFSMPYRKSIFTWYAPVVLSSFLHDWNVVLSRRPCLAVVRYVIYSVYGNVLYENDDTLGDGPVSLKHFADVAIDSHDPMITDLMTFRTTSTPKEVLTMVSRSFILSLRRMCVPSSQSKAISNRWGGVKPVVIPKQGHEMGDSGWETTVMGEILKFMEKFDDE